MLVYIASILNPSKKLPFVEYLNLKIRRKVLSRLLIEQGKEDNTLELARYLSEQVEDDEDDGLDFLLWWKLNQHRFFILSIIAQDIMVVPISTLAFEAIFSNGGLCLMHIRVV
ncbi:zinc finger BED domain-containing protein RICESLEEPER 2-like [Gossypium australe]|uniref:Zinc finger BED domain-containing protein RICESLEEPER 2-like n=1 Tax=Gossypium australe TaxID=47621 RepID=A0A5B6WYQ9_9ROSI|nr:zinc finger BED domain-containing protein RICESLEEPER 2-like [Gossypium australe]